MKSVFIISRGRQSSPPAPGASAPGWTRARRCAWCAIAFAPALAICLLTRAGLAAAADPSAVLSGTVVDGTGALVPGALVHVDGADETRAKKTVSDGQGRFSFEGLPAGRYRVTVSLPGFKPYEKTGLELKPGGSATVVATLVIAQHSEAIEVSGTAVLDRSTARLGDHVSGAEITALPVAGGGGFTDWLALQAGVVPASAQQPNAVLMSGCASTSPSGDLNPGSLSVNGQRETANGFVVNGASVEEAFNQTAAAVPNPDSVEEFEVFDSGFEAEYGNYPGAQVRVTTKGGSNELHGSLFGIARDTALDARGFFAAERARHDEAQLGTTLGGPLKKDRLFFFADYEHRQRTQGIDTGLIAVPSLDERSGSFSDQAGRLTGRVSGEALARRLETLLGYPVRSGEPYYSAGCASAAECVFPGAVIPASAWSAPAKALLGYIPLPNRGVDTFATAAQNETLADGKLALRLDGVTDIGHASAYYFRDHYAMDVPYPVGQGGASVPGFDASTFGTSQLLTLSLQTSGRRTVNEVRLSYLRAANVVGRPRGGVGPTLRSQGFVDDAGNASIVALAPQIEGVENVALNDLVIGVTITGLTQTNDSFEWSDVLTVSRGRHTLKLGATLRLDQVNIHPDAIDNGSFAFTGSATGSDFADFLLGLPSTYSQGDSDPFYLRNHYVGLYAQDSWTLRPSLTLNYGLRWDLLPPWREKLNQLQTLEPGAQSVVYPGAPRGLLFPGDPGIPDTLAPARHTNFAPRVGLVWSPPFTDGPLGRLFGGPDRTTLSASHGIFYAGFEGLSAGIMSANPPYGYDYTSPAPPLFADPFVIASTGERVPQPFPVPIPGRGATAAQPNTSVDWQQYLPVTGVPSFYRRNVNPYTESYTLRIERQLASRTVVAASYIGSQAHHLLALVSANPGNPQLCLATPGCGPFSDRWSRGPFDPKYFDAVTYQKTIANSRYSALQLSLRHETPRLQLRASYTYGRAMDQSSSLAEPLDPADPRRSWALSAFDVRHNLVASYRYELPLDGVLGSGGDASGWYLSGTVRLASGLPVTLYNNTDSSLLGTIPNGINNNGVDTLNVAPGNLALNGDPRRSPYAFNAALFSIPPLGQEGNTPRRFFAGPGLANFDMALEKLCRLSRSTSLSLRLEAYNVFNHPQFFGPAAVNGNISSSSFGRIVAANAPRQLQLVARVRF